jgi:hypothetical protein
VTVVANGFVWQERTYAGLSTIARATTGTSRNGPRFFGLRITTLGPPEYRRRLASSHMPPVPFQILLNVPFLPFIITLPPP